MSTSTLQNFRVGSDLTVKVRLKDGGVAIDWSTLSGIRAVLYSDAQSSIAGRCDVTVDGEDPTLLVCRYAATKMQYLGVNRIVVSAKYMGVTKTYDKPAFTFVRWTADQEGEQITIEDPEVTVEIDVEDVSSSILQEAIDAAISAAEKAEEAAALVPLQVLQDCVEATEDANEAAEAANAAGITSVEASVADNEPGTPSVEATLLNKILTLVFRHLKGAKGDTGATPNITIGTVTTGEPGTAVVVTMTGTTESPVLNITIPQGLKGDQGNTGSSVDYPFELVNNLTTDDATKALTAAQGVVLDGKISQLQQEVTADISQLEAKVDDFHGVANIYNGSNGNTGNANYVHTQVVKTNGARYAIIQTTRPNRAGCSYRFGYALTNNQSDIGSYDQYSRWAGPIGKVDVSSSTKASVIDLSSYPSAVGISFTIAEIDSSNLWQALRDTDFASSLSIITCDRAIEDISAKTIFGPALFGLPSATSPYGIDINTSTNKITIPNDVLGFYKNINGNNDWKSFPQTVIDWPGSESGAVYIVWDLNTSSFVKKVYAAKIEEGELFVASFRRNGDNTKVCSMFPWSVNGRPFGIQIPTTVEVVNNTTEGGTTKALSAEMGKQLQTDINNLQNESSVVTILDGSTGNPGNTKFVRTAVIPTNGARFVVLKTSRLNATGCHYGYGFALTSNLSDIGKTTSYATFIGQIIKVDATTALTENNVIDLQKYPPAVGIAFTIGEYDASGVQQTLRANNFDSYKTAVIADPATEELISAYEGGSILERNREREIVLQAMCRYRKNNTPIKDLQLCICTDSHSDVVPVNNAVFATNGFKTIDGFVHAGDICGSYYNRPNIDAFHESLSLLKKPGYIVVGNHDVGNAYYIGICCDHAQAYDAFIKPMVDRGWLVSGEYTENKPYWHHDIANYKIRLIGLYEYDDNLDFNESYWRAITYNSNLPNIALNTAYSLGTQVNVPGYTAYSFEAVQAVTTPASYYTTPEKLPSYKVRRGQRVIRQEQAQWFLDTLATTPANYGVVVILHNPFSDVATTIEAKFNQFRGASQVTGASYSQNDMATDFINDALVAFASGSEYSANVAMKGDAAYMNTQGGNTYAYSVSKDFSSKNSGVKVFGLIGGHSHRDLVWKLGNLVQISPVCATTNIANATSSDIRRQGTDGITVDSLTVISFANERIGLAKIGVNVTEDGYPRDYEVIKTN